MNKVLIIGVVVAGMGVGYYFYDKNKKAVAPVVPVVPNPYETKEVVVTPFDEIAYVQKVRQEISNTKIEDFMQIELDLKAQLADCKKVVAGEMTKLDYNIKYRNDTVSDFGLQIKKLEIALKVIAAEKLIPNRQADVSAGLIAKQGFMQLNDTKNSFVLEGIPLM